MRKELFGGFLGANIFLQQPQKWKTKSKQIKKKKKTSRQTKSHNKTHSQRAGYNRSNTAYSGTRENEYLGV